MAEAVGLAASIAGLVAICDTFITRILVYKGAIQGAKDEIGYLLQSAEALGQLLKEIEEGLKNSSGNIQATNPPQDSALVLALGHCQSLMNELLTQVEATGLTEEGKKKLKKGFRNSLKLILKKASYPLKKDDLASMAQRVQEIKITLSIAVTLDNK